jgi:hypothetical protein
VCIEQANNRMSEGEILYKAGFSAHGNEITYSKWFEYNNSDACDDIRKGVLGCNSDDDTDNANAGKNSDRRAMYLVALTLSLIEARRKYRSRNVSITLAAMMVTAANSRTRNRMAAGVFKS